MGGAGSSLCGVIMMQRLNRARKTTDRACAAHLLLALTAHDATRVREVLGGVGARARGELRRRARRRRGRRRCRRDRARGVTQRRRRQRPVIARAPATPRPAARRRRHRVAPTSATRLSAWPRSRSRRARSRESRARAARDGFRSALTTFLRVRSCHARHSRRSSSSHTRACWVRG